MRRAVLPISHLAAGCFYIGPIEDAPPPPEQAPVIEQTFPPDRTVVACPSQDGLSCRSPGSEASECVISIGLREVVDPNGVPLIGRIFLNDGNTNAAEQIDTTSLPLQFGSTTDFHLTPASTDNPTLLQLVLPSIDLSLFPAYLVSPSQNAAVNFIEIVVSDGFNDANFPADPNAFRDPAPGKSTASAFWVIDFSQCTSQLL